MSISKGGIVKTKKLVTDKKPVEPKKGTIHDKPLFKGGELKISVHVTGYEMPTCNNVFVTVYKCDGLSQLMYEGDTTTFMAYLSTGNWGDGTLRNIVGPFSGPTMESAIDALRSALDEIMVAAKSTSIPIPPGLHFAAATITGFKATKS